MQKIFDEIFKFDSKGKIRTWRMEQDGDRYRTIAGIKKGSLVSSDWTVAQPTNQGRSNARDGVAQATFEIEAAYEKKLTREYHKTIADAGDGAHFFKPMLAEKYDNFAPGFVQPKLDGIRCIAMASGLFSREGKPLTNLPHITAALAPLFAADSGLVLDGELYNHDLKDDFNAIVSAVKRDNPTPAQAAEAAKTQYWIYDAPSLRSFSARNLLIQSLLKNLPEQTTLVQVPSFYCNNKEQYDTYHGQWLEEGFEGSMWREDAPYANRRTKALKKRKEFVDQEFECVSIEEGQGNWAGVAKRVVCRLADGRTFGAGIKGNKTRAAALLHETHKVVTVKYFALTPDGIPRFPVVTQFHGAERTL